MIEPWVTAAKSEQAARAQFIRLKRGLVELKLEALRRGYGLVPADASAFDDVDAVVTEVSEDVDRLRRNHGGSGVDVDETRGTGDRSLSSRA
jgi:hypothetical protein